MRGLAKNSVGNSNVADVVKKRGGFDLIPNAHGRMEGRGGFLKDQRDGSAADLCKFFGVRLKDVLTAKENGTFRDVSIGWKQPQDGCGKRALARARFSNDAEEFALPDFKTDALQGWAHLS
ncbi:MAG: hypothetical protein WCC98_17760 [Candidatus Acidiferrales bacterium]